MINGFTIFGIKIYFYALIIITGALLGAFLATKEAKRRGFNPDMIWDVLPWLLIAGIIGARLWHIFTPPASMLIDGKNPYFVYPLDMLNIRNGGLGIPGAVMAGVLALWIYARKKKISFATWLDISAPGLALAQAIGRWGNFFNQEVYGLPSKLPWAIFIDSTHRLPGYENIEKYHPTFFYEFLWNLLNVCILLWLSRKFGEKLKKGDVFLAYLIIYPVGRFLLEFIRLEYSPIAGININQAIMAVIAVFSACFLVFRHLKKRPAETKPDIKENSAQ
ncbi:MAG: phosphatidylglycerol:prolipoprotein diacylglycerol transferase [Chloroflexi bacterium]|nr:MAG: phosphatidylglycerol:prolipoprotein diacylglycerol transferase [Chloroflexota bacterium]